MPPAKPQGRVTYRIAITPVGPVPSDAELRKLVREATKAALEEARPDLGSRRDLEAEVLIEGGFAGVGETAVVLIVKYGAIAGGALLVGAAKRAGEKLVDYLADQLRKRNVESSKAELVVAPVPASPPKRNPQAKPGNRARMKKGKQGSRR